MPELVYILCAVMSLTCALLLARSWARNRSKLLLWSTLCFALLAVNNLLLLLDLVVIVEYNLAPVRHSIALAAITLLVAGQVWESR
jgi:hypothetical protein